MSLCIRCKKREALVNPKTGLPGRICDRCFIHAIDKLFLEVDLQDEQEGITNDVKSTEIIWSRDERESI